MRTMRDSSPISGNAECNNLQRALNRCAEEREKTRVDSVSLARDQAATAHANEEVRAELAEVQAQAAAMREALEKASAWVDERCLPSQPTGEPHSMVALLAAALAPDAGRALLAELADLREVAAAARSHREEYRRCANEGGDCACDALADALDAKLAALKAVPHA